MFETQEYIRQTELIKIFHGIAIENIMKCFVRNDNELYKDKAEEDVFYKGKKHTTAEFVVYKRLKPIFEQWAEERKTWNGHHNGYQGNPNGIYQGGI